MNPPSVDIKDILEAESSLELAFETDLFIGLEPSKPDNCVTIFDTDSLSPQLTLGGDGDDYYRPSIQIRVRNTDYTVGWALAHDIVAALHGRAGETWNATLYTLIQCSSGPAFLEWDDNRNVKFVVNFNIQRRT